jgi:hypothetical protein
VVLPQVVEPSERRRSILDFTGSIGCRLFTFAIIKNEVIGPL